MLQSQGAVTRETNWSDLALVGRPAGWLAGWLVVICSLIQGGASLGAQNGWQAGRLEDPGLALDLAPWRPTLGVLA